MIKFLSVLAAVSIFVLAGFSAPGDARETLRLQSKNDIVAAFATNGLSFPRGLEIDHVNRKIYWTDVSVGAIRRADINGSNVEDVLTGLASPRDLALDVAAQKIYWIQIRGNGSTRIHRANFNGSGNEIIAGIAAAKDIALDAARGHLYFSDRGRIGRINTNGSAEVTLVSNGVSNPQGITLDLPAGRIYWADEESNQIVGANLDGSNPQVVISSGLTLPYGIRAFDGYLYWTDYGTDKVERATVSGANRTTLVTSDVSYPQGIDVDPVTRRIYWADAVGDNIRRANLNGSSVTAILSFSATPTQVSDYDEDCVDDLAIFRPNGGYWAVLQSTFGNSRILSNIVWKQWGLPGDVSMPGDYNGDGQADLVVYRPSNGVWYICSSQQGYNCSSGSATQFGLFGDIPVTADFDGDRVRDISVWRPTDGYWWYKESSTAATAAQQWGLPGDIPVAADYDGDGKDDFAIWRPQSGTWAVKQSSRNYSNAPQDIIIKQWGLAGDIPIQADYDGDGRADLGIFRPAIGTWFICESQTNYDCSRARVQGWGLPKDIPVHGDFDGDGRADIALWRPADGFWFYIASSSSLGIAEQWGLPGDQPLNAGSAARSTHFVL